MVILSLLAAYGMPKLVEQLNERRANVTAQETQQILDAARSFRAAQGLWPGGATCLNAIAVLEGTTPPYLPGGLDKNKYRSPLTTSCTATTFSIDQAIIEDWDGVVANLLPATQIVNASAHRIRTTVGVPGSEPALDSKLSRVASGNAELNRMRTNLLLGNFDIREVKNIDAVSGDFSGTLSVDGLFSAKGDSQFTKKATFNDVVVLNKVVTENTACTPNGALARDNKGVTLSCQSGVWKGNSGGLDGPYRVSGSSLGAWAICTLNYGSGNSKSLTFNNGSWFYSGSGTQVVYCYK